MQRVAEEKAIKAKQREIQEEAKEVRKQELRKRKQRKQMREENQKRGAVVVPITNTNKIKKMSKKALKQIMKM